MSLPVPDHRARALHSRSRGGWRAAGGAAGFSLVEVIVGLLVLELGLLGAAGLVAVSGRTLGRAARTERVLSAAEALSDSLSYVEEVSDGGRPVSGGGTVRWRLTRSGDERPAHLRIVGTGPGGRRLLVLHVALPAVGAATSRGEG